MAMGLKDSVATSFHCPTNKISFYTPALGKFPLHCCFFCIDGLWDGEGVGAGGGDEAHMEFHVGSAQLGKERAWCQL